MSLIRPRHDAPLASRARLSFKRGFRRGFPSRFVEAYLNYRHAFHAGNFADVFKHAVLLAWLRRLMDDPSPLELLDTHAGAGVYDLSSGFAAKSGEARGGIARFLASPPRAEPLRALTAAVRTLNGGGEGPLYPGSPWLCVQALRPGDRYLGCELRPDDADLLRRGLRAPAGVRADVQEADGYAAAIGARAGVRRAILIDPPFERGDEGAAVAGAVHAAIARGDPTAIWAPIKDLDGWDRLLARIEAMSPPASFAAEVRLRPLDAPLRLNGCALIVVGGPDLAEVAAAVAKEVAERCGEESAGSPLTRFGG